MQRTVLSLAALSALAAASPISPLNNGQNVTFSISQVPAGRAVKAAPPIALLKAISKYGGTPPSAVAQAAAAAQQSGTITATPSDDDDDEYVCAVTIGDQTLNLDFDTGSSDLWVFSTLLPSSEQSGHNVYKPSSADKETGETWAISYGDHSKASGTVYADTVVVGKITATSQAVEAATSLSSSFVSNTASDGLLGLGFSSINTVEPDQATTFFDTVKSSLSKPLFTADLKKGEAGSYDFGFIDSSKYTGSITYVDVDSSEGYWGFTADGYAIGSGSTVSTSIDAIADTGTTLLLLDDSIVDAYYAEVDGASYSDSEGGYVFSCSTTLPSFTAVIGGTKFVIPASYMNYGSVTSSECFGGLQSNTGIGLSIFGDIFLKAHFVVFDGTSSPQLGFAKQ